MTLAFRIDEIKTKKGKVLGHGVYFGEELIFELERKPNKSKVFISGEGKELTIVNDLGSDEVGFFTFYLDESEKPTFYEHTFKLDKEEDLSEVYFLGSNMFAVERQDRRRTFPYSATVVIPHEATDLPAGSFNNCFDPRSLTVSQVHPLVIEGKMDGSPIRINV